MLRELFKLASHLDQKGFLKEADMVDDVLKKYVMGYNYSVPDLPANESIVTYPKLASEVRNIGARPHVDMVDSYLKDGTHSSPISDGLRYHIKTSTSLVDNIYRVGSDSYFKIISEARKEYKKGFYKPVNEEETLMLDSNLGEWDLLDEELVPLDFPMYADTLDKDIKKESDKKDPPIGKPMKGSGSKKYQVYVRDKKTGKVKKISYGDSKGGLKGNWNNPEARSNFASRHNCADKKDRTKAGYWSCRAHKDFGTNVPGRFW